MCRTALALAVLLFAAPAPAETLPELNQNPYLSADVYAGDGPFVSWPAQAFGMTTMVLVGGSVATLCMPFDLMRGLQKGNYGGLAQYCGAGAGGPLGNGAYYLAGAPFWAVKKTFWDAPRALF